MRIQRTWGGRLLLFCQAQAWRRRVGSAVRVPGWSGVLILGYHKQLIDVYVNVNLSYSIYDSH